MRVGAVSYLNTAPLVWGMMHGAERDSVDLSFSVPSECARQLEDGVIDIGLVPVAEIAREKLDIVSNVGITCLGAVRSILLISRVPWREVRSLAADRGSRTSVELARVILRERFGTEPLIRREAPDLRLMLKGADSALIIGDPALRIETAQISDAFLDLGAEWFSLTGLPMVFAAWAARPEANVRRIGEVTRASCDFGKSRIAEIVSRECASRGISEQLGREYLTKHIRFELGTDELRGLHAFLELAGISRQPTYA